MSPRHARLALALAALAAAAACTRGAPAAEPEPDPARLLGGIVGTCARAGRDVELRRAGELPWDPAAPGAVLRAGDEVRTGPRSTARLVLLSGAALEVEASADVVVEAAPSAGAAPPDGASALARATAGGEPRVVVKEGVLRAVLPPTGAAPAVGLVVRSRDRSELRLAARPGPAGATVRLTGHEAGTEVAVVAGAVTTRGAGGRVDLVAGRVALARGGALVDAAPLLEPPRGAGPPPDARFHLAPGLAVPLRWTAVRGATGYRIQLARDPSFREVEVTQTVDGTEHLFRPAAAGVHAWRVAARDAARRWGEYGPARRFRCEEEPPRDLLVEPAPDAVVRLADAPPTQVTFSWEPAAGARAYLLVLGRGPDLLAERVASAVVPGPRAALPIPGPGDFWWGVYADPDGDPRPLFMAPRRLSLAKEPPPPPGPLLEVPEAISDWGTGDEERSR